MIYYNNNINNINLPYYSFYGFFIHKDDYMNLIKYCENMFKIFLLNTNINDHLQIILNPPYLVYSKYSKTIVPNTLEILGKEVEFNIDKIIYNTEPNFQFIVGLVKLKKNWTCNKIPHIILAKNPAINNEIILNILIKNSNYLFDIKYEGPHINAKLGLCSFKSEIHLFNPESESTLSTLSTLISPKKHQIYYNDNQSSYISQSPNQNNNDSPNQNNNESPSPSPSPQNTEEDLIQIKLQPNNPSENIIFTGRNGGKYRIINGKKYYITNKQKTKQNYVVKS